MDLHISNNFIGLIFRFTCHVILIWILSIEIFLRAIVNFDFNISGFSYGLTPIQVELEVLGRAKRSICDSNNAGLVTHIYKSGFITQGQALSLLSPMVSALILYLLLSISYQLDLYKIYIELKVLVKVVVILDVFS